MRRRFIFMMGTLFFVAGRVLPMVGQEVVDRIVARVENDAADISAAPRRSTRR